MKNPNTKPPLKWAGGKQRLLNSLLPHIPSKGRLIEPFVGAGSVFLAAGDRDLVVNDANPDLIAMFRALKRDPELYIDAARPYFVDGMHSQVVYLQTRELFNKTSDLEARAVMLLYLNRFGFNGLYRVNKTGGFNTPYGHPRTIPKFPERELRQLAQRLQHAQIMCGDFQHAMALASAGDVVYCDPPYVDASEGRASFVGYVSGGFCSAQQVQLVDETWAAVGRGATVVLSNHDTPAARSLYAGMHHHSVEVRRSIAGSVDGRGMVRELIAVASP